MLSINITPHGDLQKDTDFLNLLKESGFKSVGIELNKTDWLTDTDWKEKAISLKEALGKCEMAVSSAHLYHYPLDVGVSVKYDDTEELIRRSIESSFIIGAPFMTAHPRSSMDTGFSYEVAAKANREDFLPLIERAEKENVCLLFENMPVFPDFPGHRYFSSKPDEFSRFIDSFNSDSVGVCWDTGHSHMLLDEDEFGYMKQVGKRIKIFEVNNNWIRYDSHTLPSCGSMDWNAFAKTVKYIGFTGDLLLDAKPAKVPEIAKAYYTHAYDCMKVIKERVDKA